MTQDRYIPGVPCWVDTSRADPDATAEFYGSLFDWKVDDAMPRSSEGNYFTARRDGRDVAAIGSVANGEPASPLWNTYVWVDSADATAARVPAAGGTVVVDPTDVGEAGRRAIFADQEGAHISVWEPRRHRGATAVNEHGTVNFNDLFTRDLEAAKAFYGAVFGWSMLDLGDGLLWTLPGYGRFLDQLNPGFLTQMATMGAPTGFEDVVASLHLIGSDQPDTPAHWGVTWAVDDADEIARRAVELGGSVIAEPFDAPWVRMTVLADPEGVQFVASTFVPDNAGMDPAGDNAAAR